MSVRMEEKYREQVINMRKAGKDTIYIIEFMKETYNISLKANEIWYICERSKKKEKREDATKPVARRKYKKRAEKATLLPPPATLGTPESITEEIISLLAALNTLHVEKIKEIRIEVIKAIGEDINKE